MCGFIALIATGKAGLAEDFSTKVSPASTTKSTDAHALEAFAAREGPPLWFPFPQLPGKISELVYWLHILENNFFLLGIVRIWQSHLHNKVRVHTLHNRRLQQTLGKASLDNLTFKLMFVKVYATQTL